jgi:hypothetical protein
MRLNDQRTVETDEQNAQDIKQEDSRGGVKTRRTTRGQSYLQNTNLTTLGMFRDGFLVSPAVIPRLSVPPTAKG